ncbi:BTAD domain-containing putative transcriptional regulator [Streptomyces sp. NRRL B-1347]|uniref:BTAD domain-containing putative transcriptional regulator n=1 Tax=Streptomyces sp. NRRL B-1347 TaxID=1476877 RepID=UPI0004C7ECCE|nr:BTAD domain-containing putative transcriptional regulator [Streptomyces sp. NRRL B-1347]
MRFEVLGPLVVRGDDGARIPVPEPKVRTLLAALLARTGHPVPADTLVEDLWGAGKLPANPANSLQTKVSQLRRAIGRDTVAYGPAGYRIALADADAGEATDAARFEALTARAYRTDTGPRGQASLLTDALALWRGPAYADFRDADFTRAAAARLEEQRLTAQETLAEARLALGEHALLADDLTDLVAREPLRERLRAAHMRALYRAGRPSEALAAYHDLRTRLADELGTDPGPELAALHEAILRQDPDLTAPPADAVAPAAAVVAPPRTNLPAATTHLVGRADAVARVRELVRRERLVTLTGPGGVGKTRLALEAAADLMDDFPDGVWLVELAGTTADGVLEAVAAAVGVREDNAARQAFEDDGPGTVPAGPRGQGGAGSGNPRQAHLTRALAARRALLLLDNCEHVLDATAGLVAHLLRHAPHLRALTTSQEPLALGGETLEAVVPLGEDEAVRLFAERAAATAPGFALNDDNREAVALICRRLDGIPLAVELAATRVRALGVHALADRLHDRFRLLNQVRRDAPARQRTLRAMIDWSWELLSAPERRALRQLAVFRGGFTLESAEAVLGEAAEGTGSAGVAAGESESGGDAVLDLVARLLDRSLLATAGPGPGPDGGGPVRHRLLESVAAYSLERLAAAGESKDLARHHAHHYADLAERAAPALHGPEQRHWLRRLDAETVNLRAALDWAAAAADTPLALRLVNALTWYWYMRGRLTEAIRSLALALSLPAGHGPARASAAAARGAFSLLAGEDACAHGSNCAHDTDDTDDTDDADARSRWLLAFARCGFDRTPEEGQRVDALLAEFRAAGDRWGEAATLSARATRALYAGDLAVLRRDATLAAGLFDRLGDRWGQLQSSEQLGVLAEIAADYEGAARLQHDGVRGAEELELWTEVSFRLSRLGRLALLTGDDTRATDYHERAARLAARQSHRPAQQFAETGLALGARRRGDLDAAERLLLPWLDFNRRFGITSGAALILAQLGYAAEQRGDAARAETLHREGLDAAHDTGDNRAVALALEGLAGARALAGAHAEAAALLGRAAALRAAEGAPLPEAERADVDRATARGRAALGAGAFDTAVDAARARGAVTPPPVTGVG